MSNHDDEESMKEVLDHCEKVIEEVEEGKRSSTTAQDDLRDCIAKMEDLTRRVSQLCLFSDNEMYDELPTASLPYFLLPCYLAMATNALIVDRSEMIKYKEMSKAYFHDFLERLSNYDVIGFVLPWVAKRMSDEAEIRPAREPPAADRRLIKQKRYEQEAAMKEARENFRYQLQKNNGDDNALRSLMVVTLRLYAHKAMDTLNYLDEEINMLEYMSKLKSGEEQPLPKIKSKLPTFIIAKSAEQKKVFGLGYPAIPTVTVDEWYDGMVKSGRFAQPTANRVVGAPEEREQSEDEDAGDDDEKRAKLQRWDEYKDDHRRGWGNMHNKG